MSKLVQNVIDEFLSAYIEAALWSSNDPDTEEPLDKDNDESTVHPATLQGMRADCEMFLTKWAEEIALVDSPRGGKWSKWEQAGHDFWLTRNGHGCGFWDGDWPEGLDKALTDSCREFGEVYLYVVGGYVTCD